MNDEEIEEEFTGEMITGPDSNEGDSVLVESP